MEAAHTAGVAECGKCDRKDKHELARSRRGVDAHAHSPCLLVPLPAEPWFGEYEEIWGERIEPGHDRVIEALFDKIEATIQIGMRLPKSEHEFPRWRIAEITPDFRLEDVWTLPAEGSAEDFGALLAVMGSLDPAHGESAASRVLFSIRYRLGGWFGWDDATRELAIPGNAETTLSARLPVDLRNTATNLDRSSYGFRPLYRTDLEWPRNSRTGRFTPSCTSPGSTKGRATTKDRWECTSSLAASSGRSTWH